MADQRFFSRKGPFKASYLAEIAAAELKGDPEKNYQDVASLDNAGPDHLSFLDNRKYLKAFQKSNAGLCLVHPSLVKYAPTEMSLLITEAPYMGYAEIARNFYPVETPDATISEQASIAKTAKIAKGVRIDAGARISHNVEIGSGCWIKENAVICEGVVLGENCTICQNVTLSHSILGNAVFIHPGCHIGQDGFGFASGPEGHVRIPQLGRVIIHDHVNIGAGTTIDRGAGPDTIIGAGTQIDNLVQIGHNVEIGTGCVIVSQVGISGSTKVGNYVVMGGKVGVAGHLKIGDHVTIAAKAGVVRDIEAGQTVGGMPAIAQKDWIRQVSTLSKLTKERTKK